MVITRRDDSPREFARIALIEIIADGKAGKVPRHAATFAALHEHVDANDYLEDAYAFGGIAFASEVAALVDSVLQRQYRAFVLRQPTSQH